MIGRQAFILCATAVLALSATPHLFRQSSFLIGTQDHESVHNSKSAHDYKAILPEEKDALFHRDEQLLRELRNPDLLTNLDILFVLDPNFYLYAPACVLYSVLTLICGEMNTQNTAVSGDV